MGRRPALRFIRRTRKKYTPKSQSPTNSIRGEITESHQVIKKLARLVLIFENVITLSQFGGEWCVVLAPMSGAQESKIQKDPLCDCDTAQTQRRRQHFVRPLLLKHVGAQTGAWASAVAPCVRAHKRQLLRQQAPYCCQFYHSLARRENRRGSLRPPRWWWACGASSRGARGPTRWTRRRRGPSR